MTSLASLPTGTVRRVAFLGTPPVAASVLDALVRAGVEIPLVITRADARRGRGSAMSPSAVKTVALDHGLEVGHDPRDLLEVDAEVGVVVAFGRLIRAEILAAMPMVNLHLSLLPRWRGAAPVERALLAGDTTTGVCLMQLDEGLDTGPILGCCETPIGDEDTAVDLLERLGRLGTEILIDQIRNGFAPGVAQTGDATYATKLDAADFVIDWNEPAELTRRRIRLGRAVTTFEGSRLRILDATMGSQPDSAPLTAAPGTVIGVHVAAGDRWLRLVEVQPEGRRAMAAADWRRGLRGGDTLRLGDYGDEP